MGMKPEFYVTSESSELFGIRRADLAVTIQESEGAELLKKSGKPVINVPFYDVALENDAQMPLRTRYLSPDKVTFGVLGSDNPFNVVGMNELLASLEREISDTFAPVEVLVGGAMGDRVIPRVGVKCVGRVESEQDFYARVDYAIAPVFEGTGFKVKTADALALHMPCILSKHAALGTTADPQIVCATADDMARKMVDISLKRPALTIAHTAVRRARNDLRNGLRTGSAALLAFIEKASEPLIVDLTPARFDADLLVFQSYFSYFRVIAAYRPVLVVVADDLVNDMSFKNLLPPAVKAISATATARERLAKRLVVLDVLGNPTSRSFKWEDGDLRLWDTRWYRHSAAPKPGQGTFAGVPLFHTNLFWEPAAVAMRNAWEKRHGSLSSSQGLPLRLLFTDQPLAGFRDEIHLWSGSSSYVIPVSDWMAFQRAALSILQRRAKEVIWAARPGSLAHRLVTDACAIYDVPLRGWLDEATVGHSAPTKTLASELDQIVSRLMQDYVQRLPTGQSTKSGYVKTGSDGTERALIAVTDLPDGSHGFHRLEHDRKGSPFRWTGPGPESVFPLWIDQTQTITLTFRIISLGKNRLSDLSVDVQGETYPLQEVPGNKLAFTAGPIRALADSHPTDVTLRVSRVFQPTQEGSEDARILGVALASVDVETQREPVLS